MADDVLLVGSSFDPSGLTRGLAAGEAALKQFEQTVRQLDIQTGKALDFSTLGTLSAKAFRDSAAAVAAYEQRVRDAVESVTGLNQANINAFAGSVRASTGSAKYAAGLVALSQQQIQSTNYTSRWTAGLQALQAQQAAVAGSTAAVGRAAVASNRGVNMLRGSLVTLTAQTLQVNSAFGQLAQSGLFLATGGTGAAAKWIIGIAAGALAGAKAWEVYSKDAREAAKAAEELTERLKQLREEQKGPTVRAQEDFAAQQAEVDKLARALADVAAQRALASKALVAKPDVDLAEQFNRLLREETDATQKLAAATALLGTARKAVDATGRDLITSLERELAVLELGEGGVRQMEIALGGLDQALTADALALLKQIQQLERQKTAALESARALEALLQVQHQVRVANAGGGNLTQGAGGTAQGPFTGGLLSGASAESITLSREAAAIADAEEALQKFFKTAFAGFRGLAAHEADAVKRTEELVRNFTDMGSAAFALADVGSALGFIGEEAFDALNAVGRLSDALAAVALSASTGNILGAIAAGASVLGSLFGETAMAREHAALIQQNNERLAALRISIDTSLQGLPGFAKSSGILKLDLSGTHTGGRAELEAALEAAGLSLLEFARLVEQQTGLKILDAEGNLVGKAFRQARDEIDRFTERERERVAEEAAEEAAREAARAAEDLAQSIRDAAAAAEALAEAAKQARLALGDEVTARLNLLSRLTGDEDPVAIWKNALIGLGVGATDAFAPILGQLGNMNLADPAIQEALRQQLISWIEAANAGLLDAEDLGLTQEQFNALLGAGADVLDSFNESVGEATKSLLNVPHGLNLAALEFGAQAAGGFPTSSSFVLPEPSRGFSTLPVQRGNDGAALPMTMTVHVEAGAIVVQGSTDPARTADEVVRRLKRVSMVQFATPDKWGSAR